MLRSDKCLPRPWCMRPSFFFKMNQCYIIQRVNPVACLLLNSYGRTIYLAGDSVFNSSQLQIPQGVTAGLNPRKMQHCYIAQYICIQFTRYKVIFFFLYFQNFFNYTKLFGFKSATLRNKFIHLSLQIYASQTPISQSSNQ